MIYYYTPVYTTPGVPAGTPILDPNGDPVIDPDGDPMTTGDNQLPIISPGAGSELADPVLGQSARYDSTIPRFALQVPDETPAQSGWALKTKAQVDTDYPGAF